MQGIAPNSLNFNIQCSECESCTHVERLMRPCWDYLQSNSQCLKTYGYTLSGIWLSLPQTYFYLSTHRNFTECFTHHQEASNEVVFHTLVELYRHCYISQSTFFLVCTLATNAPTLVYLRLYRKFCCQSLGNRTLTCLGDLWRPYSFSTTFPQIWFFDIQPFM